MIRIGVTTHGRDERGGFRLPRGYVEAIQRAGAMPLLLPPVLPEPERWLDTVDAVVLSGGGDVDPVLWQGEQHEKIYGVDRERDRAEFALVRAAVARGVPVLGVCRGLQVLNVAFGGSLIAHLPDRVGDAVPHRVPPRDPTVHPITIEPDSKLAAVLGATEVAPPSWHHQAADRVADGFRVVARAPDGVIEALEHEQHPWLLAVQWHPEHVASTEPEQQRLFDALVAAARARIG
ncbi:MAG: gamma-glutamyl-gamma-aminobutyrate hydrolase family protein [Planctomycetes bacterium]|nr:gamma-glutamyl-gamma-aminobutyrate hydrolase family protein [Planctomycetota bacterium]